MQPAQDISKVAFSPYGATFERTISVEQFPVDREAEDAARGGKKKEHDDDHRGLFGKFVSWARKGDRKKRDQDEEEPKKEPKGRTYVVHLPNNLLPVLEPALAAQQRAQNESQEAQNGRGRGELTSSEAMYRRMAEGATKMLERTASRKVPLVVLLHGTDETAWGTELHVQLAEFNNGAEGRVWLEMASEGEENMILVFPQSWGWPCPYDATRTQYGWLPGTNDREYLQAVIAQVCELYEDVVDSDRIYAVGFSNGGLFLADYCVNDASPFAAACNYMGGIDIPPDVLCQELTPEQLEQLPKPGLSPTKIPFLIVTGTSDDNRGPCHRCYKAFQEGGWDVTFDEIKYARHGVYIDKMREVWRFLEKHRRNATN